MSNSTAQVLMRKGKRGAAAYIHADCASGSPQYLGPLLDVLLNPNKAIDEWETIDWCRWLLAGGRTPDEFAAVVRSYDKHDKCGLVWIPRVVAYRCRTCGISPCMSICRECFHRGDHSTHDFNMFLSQAGGACDCGDNSVMKEDGFCSNHGNKCPRPGTAPAELMCVAEAMMPRLILRLLQHFRENSGTETTSDSYRIAVQECEGYVKMLMEFNNMGDLMRSAMTKALINPQMYRNLVEPPFPDTEYGCYMCESHKMYEQALDNFPAPEPPDEYRSWAALSPRLSHHTLLDEFIFWTFKYEFPQNVVCFLLNMLPDQDYKEHLTRTFVMHYARIPLVLEAAADPDTLSNRVVHMSVQLFSNEALALRCVQQLHLLHVMVLSLRLMMGKILVKNTLHDPDHNLHYVIDCTKRVMKEHCYWPLVSDFNNVLSHKSVALLFLQDDALVDMWFEFLSMLQGMNVNIRETGGHIEFEPSSYYAAFSCELEAAAYPMWSVLAHLTEPEHAPLARRTVATALAYLQEWLDAVGFLSGGWGGRAAHASFHYPLHRYLAAFVCAAVRSMGLRARDLLPPPDLLALLAHHPLRVQSLFYEILAGAWVRNGLQIKGQAMTYIQANFCNSMVDMDIYFLQLCAAHLPADQFVDMCIDMFGVRDWLSLLPIPRAEAAEQDAMVEGLLTFLAILVSSRTNLGNDELTQSRLEVSTLLAAGDKTHSQLLELMPERSGNAHTRNFETVLKELSTYRPPPKGSENLEQGLFVPKPIVWEQYYDPLHVLRRAVHRRDFHASMERYTAYVREKQKSEGGGGGAGSGSGSGGGGSGLWPPLRAAMAPGGGAAGAGDPRALCASGVLHGALLAVLHRGVHRRGTDADPPPDHVLALAIYLLDVALQLHIDTTAQSSLGVAALGGGAEAWAAVSGVPLLRALSRGTLRNMRTVVGAVPPRAPSHPQHTAAHLDTAASDTLFGFPLLGWVYYVLIPAYYTTLDRQPGDTEWEPCAGAGAGAGADVSKAVTAHTTALALPHDMQMARGDSLQDDQSDNGSDPPLLRALEEGMESSQALALPAADHDMRLALTDHEHLDHAPLTIDYDMEEGEWSVSVRGAAEAAGPSAAADDAVPVNESIVSLLLKLHSQLAGRLDAFAADDDGADERADGPRYTGALLRRLAALEPAAAAAIAHVRRTLWPHQRERQAEQRAREQREKEERTRRARDRQQQLMREFRRRQQRFMSAAAADEDLAREWTEPAPLEEEPRCVICNTSAPTAAHEPVGLVVLLQATAALGHRRRARLPPPRLPLAEAAVAAARDASLAAHAARTLDELRATFGGGAALAGAAGADAGVHAASCGHRLHLRCLHAYLRTLHAGARAAAGVDRGEYLCPVCRQLANAALPLAPRAARPPAEGVHALVRRARSPPAASALAEASGRCMEEVAAAAGAALHQRYGSSPAGIFAFVASLVRTNVEVELVQRGGRLVAGPAPRYKPRNECVLPLLVVAGAHTRVLAATSAALAALARDTWDQLSPPPDAPPPAHAPPPPPPALAAPTDDRPVPLLLKDPLALLIHFLLLAPPDPPYLDIQDFTSIVGALYALTYYQIVCQFLANGTAEQRAALAAEGGGGGGGGLRAAARCVLQALAGSDLFTEDGPAAPHHPHTLDLAAMEDELDSLLLPFLRIAALLRHHLYGDELPLVAEEAHELAALEAYLCVSRAEAAAAAPAAAWARQLGGAAARAQLAVRRLLRGAHAAWAAPALLQLPREYERVFSAYHERACAQCGGAPKEASVCLACGALVCLKAACCRRQHRAEAAAHALECGAGTALFLVVTSTYTVVIRGRRAALWGSLYLDDYDEEDRDLKRGKPLYLSHDRLQLLQDQWLAHRFDHTKRTWVWHRDSL